MDAGNSIVEFFYNIVPGSLFLFALNYFCIINFNTLFNDKSDLFVIFVYAILGLFLGFLFQGITKIAREKLGWNNRVFEQIKKDNPYLGEEYNSFSENKKIKSAYLGKKFEYKNLFYLIDASIRKDSASFLPTHFSSLFAFWANIFCGTCLLIIFLILRLDMHLLFLQFGIKDFLIIFPILLFVVFALFSWCLAERYLKSFYDTMLTCFYISKYKKSFKLS